MQKITTFLMFEGRAEEAMTLYTSLFADAAIESLTRHGDDAGDSAGKVQHAVFSLAGQRFMCIDSPVEHAFGFTPATSLFVTCDSEAEVDALFAALSEDGEVMMPLDSYPFARRFAWLSDRFGVSWQLSLA